MKHDFLTRMREIFAHFLSKLNEDTCHYINGPETLPPPLTKAEEQVVFQNIRDGKPNARDPLITHNLRLVVYIAKKFESPAVNVEDLKDVKQACHNSPLLFLVLLVAVVRIRDRKSVV